MRKFMQLFFTNRCGNNQTQIVYCITHFCIILFRKKLNELHNENLYNHKSSTKSTMSAIHFPTLWKQMKNYLCFNYPEILTMCGSVLVVHACQTDTNDENYKIPHIASMLLIVGGLRTCYLLDTIRDLTHNLEDIKNENTWLHQEILRMLDSPQNANPTPSPMALIASLLQPEFPAQAECTICCKKYGRQKTQLLSCGHKFHLSCIFNWFSQTNTCPICRQKHTITST